MKNGVPETVEEFFFIPAPGYRILDDGSLETAGNGYGNIESSRFLRNVYKIAHESVYGPYIELLHRRYGSEYVKVELGPGRIAPENRRGHGTLGLNPSADYFCDIYHDLEYGLPFPDDSIDEYYSSQVLEHISQANQIQLWNEMYRTLKPGGFMIHRVPMFPSQEAIADPTHRAYFVPRTFQYYCRVEDGRSFTEQFSDYGITAKFVMEKCEINGGVEIVVQMRKPSE